MVDRLVQGLVEVVGVHVDDGGEHLGVERAARQRRCPHDRAGGRVEPVEAQPQQPGQVGARRVAAGDELLGEEGVAACALDDLAGRARLIEAQPVPLGAELDNVIVLSRRRRDNPRFAQDAAVARTAEALIERLERATRSPADARAIVARVLAATCSSVVAPEANSVRMSPFVTPLQRQIVARSGMSEGESRRVVVAAGATAGSSRCAGSAGRGVRRV